MPTYFPDRSRYVRNWRQCGHLTDCIGSCLSGSTRLRPESFQNSKRGSTRLASTHAAWTDTAAASARCRSTMSSCPAVSGNNSTRSKMFPGKHKQTVRKMSRWMSASIGCINEADPVALRKPLDRCEDGNRIRIFILLSNILRHVSSCAAPPENECRLTHGHKPEAKDDIQHMQHSVM